MNELRRNVSELLRIVHSMSDVGVITDVDHAAHKIRISADGENKTDWLDWPAEHGANYTRWRPLKVGQGVMYHAPGGDVAQAKVVAMLHTDSIPPPSSDPEVDVIQFANGNQIAHSMATGKFTVIGDIDVLGSLSVSSDVTVAGKVSAAGDVTGAAISLTGHDHQVKVGKPT